MPTDRDEPTAQLPAPAAVSAFLRALAKQVERDPLFGERVGALLAESGLLAAAPDTIPAPHPPSRARRERGARGGQTQAEAADKLGRDPFVLFREGGGDSLRAHLDTLDVRALRELVRQHHLDPARISARWNNRERLSMLIVDQIRARADHGKAFARV